MKPNKNYTFTETIRASLPMKKWWLKGDDPFLWGGVRLLSGAKMLVSARVIVQIKLFKSALS